MNLIKAVNDNVLTELEEVETELVKTANRLRDLTIQHAKLTALEQLSRSFEVPELNTDAETKA